MTTSASNGVLIISTALDLETDAVVRALTARGVSCMRVNSEAFPFEQNLTWSSTEGRASIAFDGREVSPSSVWLRKLRAPAQPPSLDEGVYDFCRNESYRTLFGALMTISDCRYMSPIDRIFCAENKIYQINSAQRLGIRVPQTVVTNRPQAVLDAFKRFHGRMVCKSIHSGFVDDGETGRAIYTSRVLEEHLAAVESAALCPSIYQELLEKQHDVRVVWIGGTVLAASIDSQSDPAASVDWRATKNPHLPHAKIELPASVLRSVDELMLRLGLSYGALDFVLTKSGEWIFLEVNPNGQWLWLDDFLSLGVTTAVADWLSGTSP